MKNAYTRERFPVLYKAEEHIVSGHAGDLHSHEKKHDKINRPVIAFHVVNAFTPPQPTGYIKCRKHEHF